MRKVEEQEERKRQQEEERLKRLIKELERHVGPGSMTISQKTSIIIKNPLSHINNLIIVICLKDELRT